MGAITATQIIEKIELLPDDLLQEVDNYLDFLVSNTTQTDWADHISKNQISLIDKGRRDISENMTIPHEEAKQRIKLYIKNKSE